MKYFGTDGIRGIPNQTLTNETVYKVGRALRALNKCNVFVATDTRLSKDMLLCSLASGCMSAGLNVHILGVLPTPALMYYSSLKDGIGVMITASHNPYFDNGIKVIVDGRKLNEDEEEKIEKYMEIPVENSDNIGVLFYENNAKKEYQDFLLSKAKRTRLNVCLDCANGATSIVAEEVFSYLNPKTKIYAALPNGININDSVGSTNVDYLAQRVVENNYDIGFAFDGDGDRVICVDSKGNVIDGDKLIYLTALYLRRKNELNNNTVALSLMSDLGLIKELNKNGIFVIECPVGDKYIYKEMVNNNLSIGGESSGHIIVTKESNTGDGLLVAIIVLNILEETGISIDEVFNTVDFYNQKLLNLRVKNKEFILNSKKLFNEVEKYKAYLNNDCKIIVRASGTEDLLRILVMAKNKQDVNDITLSISNTIKEIDNYE